MHDCKVKKKCTKSSYTVFTLCQFICKPCCGETCPVVDTHFLGAMGGMHVKRRFVGKAAHANKITQGVPKAKRLQVHDDNQKSENILI